METEKTKLERKFFLMEKAPVEMMREFVRSQKFTSTDEVMTWTIVNKVDRKNRKIK